MIFILKRCRVAKCLSADFRFELPQMSAADDLPRFDGIAILDITSGHIHTLLLISDLWPPCRFYRIQISGYAVMTDPAASESGRRQDPWQAGQATGRNSRFQARSDDCWRRRS